MRARRVDGNQKALRETWRKLGGTWLTIAPEQAGAPDALLGWNGKMVLVEVKDPRASNTDRKLRPEQVKWHAEWRGQKPVKVETVKDLHDIWARLSVEWG